MIDRGRLIAALEHVELAPETLAALARYAELVAEWSERHSLVRFASEEDLIERHILDSLAGLVYLGNRGILLDVGSGAGLPGVPLLIARRGWRGVLLEPRQKRWAFLKRVARELELEVKVSRERYQDHHWEGAGYDAITARALGKYDDLLWWAEGAVRARGSVLLWLTEDVVAEVNASAHWRVLSSRLPALERGRLVQYQACFT